jgi:hypothetical protein
VAAEKVTASEDVPAADWIASRLHPFGMDTGSVIPTGFEAYCRTRDHVGLVTILERHTSTPDRCWFCLWDGYGSLHPGGKAGLSEGAKRPRLRRFSLRLPQFAPRRPQSKLVELPNREYRLFIGAVVAGEGWDLGPNLWWPYDRAWCVASEMDLDYTLVGGTEELINELVGISNAIRVTEIDPL